MMHFLLLGSALAAAAATNTILRNPRIPQPQGPQSLYPAQNIAFNKLSGTSAPSYGSAPPSYDTDACAQVGKEIAAQPNQTAPVHVSIESAWNCLQSVPLHTQDALEFLTSVRPYVEWQSTLAYLKDPPPGYLEPAVDVFGLLDEIEAKLHSGGYKNEYEFEFDLYSTFQKTHDGHFRVFPNILSIFSFRRPISLVSVSKDGKTLPQPYVYTDIVESLATSNATWKPSAVTEINGQDALTYLENWAQVGSLQDPDALYNNNFFSLAALAIGSAGTGGGLFAGYGRGGYNYAGPSTSITFQNGTTRTFDNFAVANQKDFTGIKTGDDLYYKYLYLPEYVPTPSTPSPTAPSPAPGFPSPIIKEYNNYIGGYYIDTPGYEDVAVISMPSFVGDGAGPGTFQQVGLDFLYRSKQDGKKKLIIDVSVNGGGSVHEGYNLFAELFPELIPYGATRFRAHEAFDIIGNLVSNASGPVYPPSDVGRPQINEFAGEPFNYRADVDNDYKPFRSWQEKFGPNEFYGDEFTPIIRWNLSDYYGIGLNVSGYGSRSHVVTEKFYNASDIVVVYDGYCASTCTIFSEFMRQQGGVKAIALGGRSREGIIQAVGGVKGTNDYLWTNIYETVNATFAIASPEQAAELSQTILSNYTTLPFRRSSPVNNAINVRDGIRQGDTSQTPTQFRYEAADCRIYYTPEMTVRAAAIWEAAADVMWGGKSCVAGSLAPGAPKAIGEKRHARDTALSKKSKRSTIAKVDAAAILSALADLEQGQGYGGDGYMPPI